MEVRRFGMGASYRKATGTGSSAWLDFRLQHVGKPEFRDRSTEARHRAHPYCNAIKIGIKPWPSTSGRKALPITAPNALIASFVPIA